MPSIGGVSYISMVEGEDWLFRPVTRGLLRGESIIDGTVDIAYIALLNEVIDVEIENTARINSSRKQL